MFDFFKKQDTKIRAFGDIHTFTEKERELGLNVLMTPLSC
jgi:hypothetical protein